jgi:hypothetical protein
MNCGVCNRVMRKDVKIDDVQTCHVCRKIWIENFKKMRKYAIENKEKLKY